MKKDMTIEKNEIHETSDPKSPVLCSFTSLFNRRGKRVGIPIETTEGDKTFSPGSPLLGDDDIPRWAADLDKKKFPVNTFHCAWTKSVSSLTRQERKKIKPWLKLHLKQEKTRESTAGTCHNCGQKIYVGHPCLHHGGNLICHSCGLGRDMTGKKGRAY